jgi:hypothetical protein
MSDSLGDKIRLQHALDATCTIESYIAAGHRLAETVDNPVTHLLHIHGVLYSDTKQRLVVLIGHLAEFIPKHKLS